MDFTSIAAIAATIIFTSLAVIVAVGIVVDALRYIAETFTDEVREVPVECEPEIPCDEFDTLYTSVAKGDRSDRTYWLGSVKGGSENA